MPRDFFDPTPEQQNVVLIDAATLLKAQRIIAGCEACSEDAELPFENVLDRLTGCDPSITDYVFEAPARCPKCGAAIHEKSGFGVMRFFVVRISTGEYLTKVRLTSNYLEYELTTDREKASRLNDFDSQLVLKRLRTLREDRARREEID